MNIDRDDARIWLTSVDTIQHRLRIPALLAAVAWRKADNNSRWKAFVWRDLWATRGQKPRHRLFARIFLDCLPTSIG
jgi:hypothetical protein